MKVRDFLRAKQEPGWKVLTSLIAHHNGADIDRNFGAAEVERACTALGLHTPSDLNQFVQNPLDARFLQAVRAVIEEQRSSFVWERDLLVIQNKAEIEQAIRHSPFALRSDFHIDPRYYRDAYYEILPVGVGALQDLLSQSKVRGRRYLAHRRDCEDLAGMFMAELAQARRGTLAIGVLEFTALDAGGGQVFRHAVNFSVHKASIPIGAHDFYLFDPASHAIWRHPDDTPYYHADQVSILLDKVTVY